MRPGYINLFDNVNKISLKMLRSKYIQSIKNKDLCSFRSGETFTNRLTHEGYIVCINITVYSDDNLAHPLQQAGRVLANVCEAGDDVVQVEVTEGGMVLTLPPHLENRDGYERM